MDTQPPTTDTDLYATGVEPTDAEHTAEVAHAIVSLADEAASGISGQHVAVAAGSVW